MEFQNPAQVAPRGLLPVDKALPPAIERLIREVGQENIILFGSYACGNPTPDSDMDFVDV